MWIALGSCVSTFPLFFGRLSEVGWRFIFLGNCLDGVRWGGRGKRE